jgi:hypothetical protein
MWCSVLMCCFEQMNEFSYFSLWTVCVCSTGYRYVCVHVRTHVQACIHIVRVICSVWDYDMNLLSQKWVFEIL